MSEGGKLVGRREFGRRTRLNFGVAKIATSFSLLLDPAVSTVGAPELMTLEGGDVVMLCSVAGFIGDRRPSDWRDVRPIKAL